MTKIITYDSTLRDGEQSEGVSLSLEDKLRIAWRLDEFGIDIIEGGFPGSNPKDIAFFRELREHPLKHARIAAFGSTCKKGVLAADDPGLVSLVESGAPIVAIVGKAWDAQVERALLTSLDENLRMISDSIAFLKEHDLEVVFDAEHFFDGYAGDSAYALKAIEVIQFKLEGHVILRHPEYEMNDRLLLDKINLEKSTVVSEGVEYKLNDVEFPTLVMGDCYTLDEEESFIIDDLRSSFLNSATMQKHAAFLYEKGCLYKRFNGNLLYHGCVPLDENGNLEEISLFGEPCSGRKFFDLAEEKARRAFLSGQRDKDDTDFLWYLWCGPDSPLFDKSRMTTFERYFLSDPATHHEEKGAYFRLRNDENVCNHILDSFGVQGKHRHIINGHVPVHVSAGESPIKANGRLMVIDGGFSQHYHSTTGIAGYTLVFHSRGFELIQHEPFTSKRDAIQNGSDIHGSIQLVELSGHRIRVRDTDHGRKIQKQIAELRELLYAYRHGYIRTK